jgi:hypothetical protein
LENVPTTWPRQGNWGGGDGVCVGGGALVAVDGGVSVGRTGVSVGKGGVLVGQSVSVGTGVAVPVGVSRVRVDVGVWVGSDVRVGTDVAVGSDTLVAVGVSEVETPVAAIVEGACVGWVGPQAAKNRTPVATVTSSICHRQALPALFCRARLRPSPLIGHLPDTDVPPHGDECIPRSQLGNWGPGSHQYTIDRVEIQKGIRFDRRRDLWYAVGEYVYGPNLCNDIERNIGAP